MKLKYWPYLVFFTSFNGLSEETAKDLFSLSLEELMDIKISTGSLTASDVGGSASAITLIRQEQITYSSAKNLTSLLAQYVPGLLVMTHSEGDKIGLRGHIAAENYKLLLLVNGKNITNMVYEGAITELDQWELHDIEQVEVVRGPGSVTYGSGAIAGVINIITKNANSDLPFFEVNLSGNDSYRSKGGSVQFKHDWDELSLYTFLSHRESDGDEDPNYFVLGHQADSDNRYLGKSPNDVYGPQDYLADTFSRPQVKAHIDVNYGENLNVWARYTQSGQSHHFVTQSPVQDHGQESIVNGRQVELSSFIGAVNHEYDINALSHLASSFSYDNQEYIRWNKVNTQSEWESPDNIKDYAFSQERFNGSLLYRYSGWEDINFVSGIEYSKIVVGSPWHKDKDHVWIREGVNLISNFDSSVYMQDPTLNSRPKRENSVEIGSGITTETYTHLIEISYPITTNNRLTYSHRIDYPDIASTMYSPRLSLVSQLDDKNTLVISAQRALRMMPIRAQYLIDKFDQDASNSEHESIDSLELALNSQVLANTSVNFRTYYNDIHAIGFTGGELQFLSDYELFGVDLELNYKHDNFDFIVNHAYIKSLDVDMSDDLKNGRNRNNISFSDYYYQTRGDIALDLTGYGNGLNNVPENITKFIITAKFFDNQLVAQINSQLYWHYDGSYDEMHMYQQAYDDFDTDSLSNEEQLIFKAQKEEFEHERQLLDKEDGYQFDYSVNMSLTYHWQYNEQTMMSLSAFIDNATESKKTYYVSTGSSGPIPERLKYLEDPTTIGVNFSLAF